MPRRSPVQRRRRYRPFRRTAPHLEKRACRAGQIAGAQEMHRIAQFCRPFGAPRKPSASLGGAQGKALSQQGVGDSILPQHKMQVRQRSP
jgi:hypothetical protein